MYDKCAHFVNESKEGNLYIEMDVNGYGNMSCNFEIVIYLRFFHMNNFNRTTLEQVKF